MRSGRRPACRVDPVQGGEEVCQVGSELRQVTNCLFGDQSTVDPPVHRPWPGETASRHAYRQRLRYRQWQLASQDGKPALLLLNRRDILLGAGQPDRHLIAQPECRIVPAIGVDSGDRQACPLRELHLDQRRHQPGCDPSLPHEWIVATHTARQPQIIARSASLLTPFLSRSRVKGVTIAGGCRHCTRPGRAGCRWSLTAR